MVVPQDEGQGTGPVTDPGGLITGSGQVYETPEATPELRMMFVVSLVQMNAVEAGSKVTLGLGFTTTVEVKSSPSHPAALGVIV